MDTGLTVVGTKETGTTLITTERYKHGVRSRISLSVRRFFEDVIGAVGSEQKSTAVSNLRRGECENVNSKLIEGA